jgi:hypothetical protein
VRLFCICVVLCVGSGLARAGLLPKESYHLCKKDYETQEEARAKPKTVESLMNGMNKTAFSRTVSVYKVKDK